MGLGHGPVLLRRLPVGDQVDEATSKQASSTASVLVSSACFLIVVSWLTYPFVLSGMKHLRTHECVGQLPVDAEDWTSKGAVMPVKNQGQFDS